jgi:8-oxo-dGTP pyrophosphatase MutT (NUDIX family)
MVAAGDDGAMNAVPAKPRPAATVMLVRDAPAGIEVLMVTRNVASDFASGALVFPGGRVDAGDSAPAMLECCRAVPGVAPDAMAFRVAGIRETFEEARLLLVRRPGEDRLMSSHAVDALEARVKSQSQQTPQLADLVATGEIELASDLMVPFAHWITPVDSPKRYDTLFFLAPAPEDQVAAHDGREAVEAVWISPEAAIAAADAKRATLVFATRLNLLKLSGSRSVGDALAAARAATVVTVCPEVVETPEGTLLRIPPHAGYGVTEMLAKGMVRAWTRPRGEA